MTTARPLGIDVGGSGIKGAPVDLEKGEFAQERFKIETPEKSTPEAVCDIIAEIVDHFDEVHDGSPIGVTVPGVVQHGVVKTAANIHKSWIGCEIEKLLEDRLQHDVVVVNDADAAGVGELYFGAAQGQDGLVVLTTLGTGIGTAVMYRGVLVPNSELGHLEIDGIDAETVTASSAKTREDLIWPDLFVVGGGISRKAHKFLPLLDLRTPIVPATLENAAGIIGAALLAQQTQESRGRHKA
jgi:polyphosphate glucokinase